MSEFNGMSERERQWEALHRHINSLTDEGKKMLFDTLQQMVDMSAENMSGEELAELIEQALHYDIPINIKMGIMEAGIRLCQGSAGLSVDTKEGKN